MAHQSRSDVSYQGFVKPSASVRLRIVLTAAALSCLLLAACGGGSPTGPSAPSVPPPAPAPTPVPAPTPASPFTQTLTGTVGPLSSNDWLKQQQFVAPRDGAATITLRWASGAVDLDLALTDGACSTGANCAIFQSSTGSSGTTERITRNMRAGEAYLVVVLNYGSVSQGYTVDIDIR